MQSVEWMRDGFPLDNTGPLILTNTSTASYTNTLDVSGRLPGTYTCQIRGSDNQILNSVDVAINGIYIKTCHLMSRSYLIARVSPYKVY